MGRKGRYATEAARRISHVRTGSDHKFDRRDQSTAKLVITPLATVHYAYSEFPGDYEHIEAARLAVLHEHARLGAQGQGAHFPLFTEHYLGQELGPMIPTEIFAWIRSCSQSFLESQAPSVDVSVTDDTIRPLWGNVNWAGEYHASHNHALGDFVLSGVIFISAPPDLDPDTEGLLVLERSNVPGIGGRFDLVYRPDDKMRFKPFPGWMILFPPFIRHYVTPHRSSEPRISIAFNIGKEAVVGPKSKVDPSLLIGAQG